MAVLQQLIDQYGSIDFRDLGSRQLQQLRDGIRTVLTDEISSAESGKAFIDLLRKFREAVAENDKLHGENYPKLLNSLLSVGEDGLYSNSLRFVFELIQNVDDCEYHSSSDCKLDMHFDFEKNEIILTYNETGFTPFNVFAITGIAEAAKNVSATKNQIGEKGIGFKSVFGVAKKVLIRSGWFSFALNKDNFTIPFSSYIDEKYFEGTQMTLYVPGKARAIYNEIKQQYCKKDALFSKNPLLFLNKLTSLKFYFDTFRSMTFTVSRSDTPDINKVNIERNVEISVDLNDYDNGMDTNIKESITCSRYSYPVIYRREACVARYGEKTKVGITGGKPMILRCIVPDTECLGDIVDGSLYSFLPTQIKLNVPVVFHVPFKLDASREFVDPQDNNLWFTESSRYFSELADSVYMDWCKIVKEDIVKYLPGKRESLFAGKNEKEKCLTCQNVFEGSHFIKLPVFHGMDDRYYTVDEIFCFDDQKQISEPKRVYRLSDYRMPLFLTTAPMGKFGIKTEKQVLEKMLNKAFYIPENTSEILDYLDSVNYSYNEKQINTDTTIRLSADQIKTILNHRKLAIILQSMACRKIQNNMRLKIEIEGNDSDSLLHVIQADFELSDTPKQVRRYMEYCSENCICLDIEKDDFFPCYNAIILSKQSPLTSFVNFCRKVDPNDPFTTRITWREKSNELNRYMEDTSIPDDEYLRILKQIRTLIKDSLGRNGYRSYFELILRSGTDKSRFVQELLQNADDCIYPPDVLPEFKLSKKNNIVTTEYNEEGFNRLNLRSITAIGESTKNRLLSSNLSSIGEKGVGFKTIFAVSSEVRIHSGDYHFRLTDQTPTIPEIISDEETETTVGTRMEITVKDNSTFPSFKTRALLELCLCLRNLKQITIDGHEIKITDTDATRTVVIDSKHEYTFKRFVHRFIVTDAKAIEERNNGVRDISPEQSVICFVPTKNSLTEYFLYCGLPTKHKIKIPLVIDAPFSLTTSREEIETDSSAWNTFIRDEMYKAILELIGDIKEEERSKIFRFIKFVPRFFGTVRQYVNDISDCKFVSDYTSHLNSLKNTDILPTYVQSVFAVPSRKTAYRFPEAVTYILNKLGSFQEYAGISAASIIDVESQEYEAALNALECTPAPFYKAYSIIEEYAGRFIQNAEFSSKLYEYLKDTPDEFKSKVRQLPVIPVYDLVPGKVRFIPWKENSIFVKPGTIVSNSSYFILNEKTLPKSDCENIFSANINEMNSGFERQLYNDDLKNFIMHNDEVTVYRHLISEFERSSFLKNESFGVLHDYIKYIPWKNELRQIFCGTVFCCSQPKGYFSTEMLQKIIADKECEKFAREMQFQELSEIHYDDLNYHEQLTDEDIECLQDSYFNNSGEILRGFYYDGLISEKLIHEYDLDYLAYGRHDGKQEYYEFPSESAGDCHAMVSHVCKLWKNPIKIVTEKVERSVKKGQNKNGSTFDLNINDSRQGALSIYSPEDHRDKCFCQMCKQVKSNKYIEVNNVESEPDYYFPQLRIALCLECSKLFEALRKNRTLRESFYQSILNVYVWSEGTIEVPIGSETITFTGKHLAEIQEILRRRPSE